VRVYFDVSCLNRPYDDQRQLRVRLEAEAILLALRQVDIGEWAHLSSDMAVVEINAMPDEERRRRVLAMLPAAGDIMAVVSDVLARAADVQRLGFGAADAVQVAAAEAQRPTCC
jgi:hypothetical protein